MNVAFVLLGAVMIIGSPLIYQEFDEATGTRFGSPASHSPLKFSAEWEQICGTQSGE